MGAEEVTARDVLAALGQRSQSIAVAESLTGGLLGAAFVAVPGASEHFRAGITAYQERAKVALLGVLADELDRHGAVSSEVAIAMARGVRSSTNSDWAIATTGVAGPGPSGGVAAGTVWLAIHGAPGDAGEEVTYSRLLHLHGSRDTIRQSAVSAALELALRTIVHPHRPLSDARGTV